MPIGGFRAGDRVITPGGHYGTVRSAGRVAGREQVVVEMLNGALGVKKFDGAALRLRPRGRKEAS